MKNSKEFRPGARVLGVHIDALSWGSAISQILTWGRQRESRSVCLCNVHSSVTAHGDKELAEALDASNMVLPDGAPIAWMLRHYGFQDQTRIAGPDLMLKLCNVLSQEQIGIFLFGSDNDTLGKLKASLMDQYPKLSIVGALSPPFGNWSEELTAGYIDAINNSGAGIVFVGLGCPRQEIWMAAHTNQIKAVLIGVGAAFNFHAGIIKRAPEIMQRLGLEWLHRFASEPRRLWKRYVVTNSCFLWLAAQDLRRINNRNGME